MVSGRPAFVSLFPARRSLRIPTHSPTQRGSAARRLSDKMSQHTDFGTAPSGTRSSLLALNDSMYRRGRRPITAGTSALVKSHPRKNSTRRFTRPLNVSGSERSGFFPRDRNSRKRTSAISSGSRSMAHPDRSRPGQTGGRERPIAHAGEQARHARVDGLAGLKRCGRVRLIGSQRPRAVPDTARDRVSKTNFRSTSSHVDWKKRFFFDDVVSTRR